MRRRNSKEETTEQQTEKEQQHQETMDMSQGSRHFLFGWPLPGNINIRIHLFRGMINRMKKRQGRTGCCEFGLSSQQVLQRLFWQYSCWTLRFWNITWKWSDYFRLWNTIRCEHNLLWHFLTILENCGKILCFFSLVIDHLLISFWDMMWIPFLCGGVVLGEFDSWLVSISEVDNSKK